MGDRKRGLARMGTAIVLLLGLGVLQVYSFFGVGPTHADDVVPVVAGVVATIAALAGLAAGRWWGRWLGLAHGVTCTVVSAMAVVGFVARGDSFDRVRFVLAVGPLGLALLACLSGRTMFDRFDVPAGRADGARAAVARWAAIANASSLFMLLFLSVTVLENAVVGTRQGVLVLVSTALVLAAVALLARGKTLGVLLAPAACLLQTALLVSMGAGRTRLMFSISLAPGLILALAATVAYSAPIWRFLRGR